LRSSTRTSSSTGRPQEGQNRAPAGTADPHVGHPSTADPQAAQKRWNGRHQNVVVEEGFDETWAFLKRFQEKREAGFLENCVKANS